jgi:sugar lactone lactonase YvrE
MDRREVPGRWMAAMAAVALLGGCTTGAGVSPATQSAATAAATAVATLRPTAAITPAPSAPPPPALALLWERSGPTQPTPCCQTWWPAIDPSTGNIWVANSYANEYWIFAPDGTFKESWGTPGSSPGQFDFSAHRHDPQSAGAIAFAPDGTFYVADPGNKRIQKFDAKRHLLTTWGKFGSGDGQFGNPFGIVTDGKTVYVSDDDRGDIQAFDASGKFLRVFGPIELNAGIFMAIDSKGTLYRAAGEANPSILRYAADGTVAATIDTGITNGFVTGQAIDGKGNLFVCIAVGSAPGHELAEFDSAGTRLGLWSTGGETAVIDPSDAAIYLASDGNEIWPTASLRKYALP